MWFEISFGDAEKKRRQAGHKLVLERTFGSYISSSLVARPIHPDIRKRLMRKEVDTGWWLVTSISTLTEDSKRWESRMNQVKIRSCWRSETARDDFGSQFKKSWFGVLVMDANSPLQAIFTRMINCLAHLFLGAASFPPNYASVASSDLDDCRQKNLHMKAGLPYIHLLGHGIRIGRLTCGFLRQISKCAFSDFNYHARVLEVKLRRFPSSEMPLTHMYLASFGNL